MWMLCGVAVILWLTANQAGGSLTLFAAMNTVQQVAMFGRDFQIGPGHFASLHGVMGQREANSHCDRSEIARIRDARLGGESERFCQSCIQNASAMRDPGTSEVFTF